MHPTIHGCLKRKSPKVMVLLPERCYSSSDVVEITNDVQLWQRGREKRWTQKAVFMTASDKQMAVEKPVNSYLDSDQASNAWLGNCTLHNTEAICPRLWSEERTAPQLLSMDYCTELNRLILLNYLGTVNMEWRSPNDSWDLEFP